MTTMRRLTEPRMMSKHASFALTSSAQTRLGPREDDQTYRHTPSGMFARRRRWQVSWLAASRRSPPSRFPSGMMTIGWPIGAGPLGLAHWGSSLTVAGAASA
jgi:hypothetical protein